MPLLFRQGTSCPLEQKAAQPAVLYVSRVTVDSAWAMDALDGDGLIARRWSAIHYRCAGQARLLRGRISPTCWCFRLYRKRWLASTTRGWSRSATAPSAGSPMHDNCPNTRVQTRRAPASDRGQAFSILTTHVPSDRAENYTPRPNWLRAAVRPARALGVVVDTANQSVVPRSPRPCGWALAWAWARRCVARIDRVLRGLRRAVEVIISRLILTGPHLPAKMSS